MDQLANNYSTYIEAQLARLKKKSTENIPVVNPFITISRETGAYGITISKGLSAYLNKKNKTALVPWTVFNRAIIKNITESKHLPETIIPHLNKSTVTEIQSIMNDTFESYHGQHLFVQETSRSILHLAQLGNAIIVGCASNIITSKLPGGFHVRLISPFENRVEHIQEYYPMSEKEAREYIFAEEGNRKAYLKKYFQKDIDDPAFYNVVFNVDVLEPEDVIQIIGDAVIKKYHLR